MAQTNMDIKNNKEATAPIMEFMLPKSEVDADLKVGQHGKITIDVEVISIGDGMISFRKESNAVAGRFSEETIPEMRGRIIKKQEQD